MRALHFEWKPINWLFGRQMVQQPGSYIRDFWFGFGPILWLYRTEGY